MIKKFGVVGILILCIGMAVMQFRVNRLANAESARLRSELSLAQQEIERQRDELAKGRAAKDSKILTDNKLEILKLRADLSAARSQLAIASQKRVQPTASSISHPNESDNTQWLQTFSTELKTTVPHGQSLLTGGWSTGTGKHIFAVITPVQIDAVGNATTESHGNQVTVSTLLFETSENTLQHLGLQALGPNDLANVPQRLLTATDIQNLSGQLRNTTEANIFAVPNVTTLDGREALISVQESFTAPNGNVLQTGPEIRMIPKIGANQSGIDVTATVQLGVRKSANVE